MPMQAESYNPFATRHYEVRGKHYTPAPLLPGGVQDAGWASGQVWIARHVHM
jgi:hypothetical protein